MPKTAGECAMTRRGDGFRVREVLLGVLLACLAALFVAGCSGTGETAKEEGAEPPTRPGTTQEKAEVSGDRPNIVFVLTDDLDYASTRKMPDIGALLAEEGISFENAFASHPICCPSRATILTGLYDHNHDVRTNAPPGGGFRKFRDEGREEASISVGLQEGGYRTAFFGKYLNGYPDGDPTHVPPGWDEWYGKLQEQELYDYQINENGEVISYGSDPEDFFTDVLSGQATDFVERAASEDQPFFMFVAPTAPHAPATPAERHEGAFASEEVPRPPSYNEEDVSDKPPPVRDAEPIAEEDAANIDDYYRQRLESMLAVDEMVSSLVQELEAAGELENTFIFFASDNGWHQGEHRIHSEKNRIYEESARIPLLVRGPGVPAGAEVEKLAINTDLAPTFAELAGVSFPTDGRSLAPLLRGEEPASWRSAVLLERLPAEESGGDDKAGRGKAGRGKQGMTGPGGVPKSGPGSSGTFGAIRTETHKYVEYDNGDRELYDLATDPYELENVYESADPSPLLEDLEARLEALRNCSEDGCREAEDAP